MTDMNRVIVKKFGGPEVLELELQPMPEPGPGQVRVRITSIGMNHAELMGRAGKYKLSTGEPPYVPGIEGGGIIDAVGPYVTERKPGDRVVLAPDAPRAKAPNGPNGTYVSHYLTEAEKTIPAPDNLPDDQLGTLWLTYLTAWGCLIGFQHVGPGTNVVLPAASSGVALAAAQIVKAAGGRAIGLTTSQSKVETLKSMPEADYDSVIVTHKEGKMTRWYRDVLDQTEGRGADVFFDPVAAGEYLNTEIRCLAQNGTIWVYGLLEQPGVVDVTPLIRKNGAIKGWLLGTLGTQPELLQKGFDDILGGFASRVYRQRIAAKFPLVDVRHAHEVMEEGKHIGKLVLTP